MLTLVPLLVCAEAEPRYLLFDVVPHEQLNKQRRALMFYLELALKLERTLVLPRARLLRRGARRADSYEYARWSRLFNRTRLGELLPVLELDEYLQLQQPQIDLLYMIPAKGCDQTSRTHVHFNGVDRVGVSELRCDAGAQYRVSELQGLSHRAIGFLGSTDQLQRTRALVLRPNVRFIEHTYAAAKQFVERNFEGEPFIAVHWRRTDFLLVRRSQPGVLQSASALIAHVRRVQSATGIPHVYIATDSDDAAELAVVQAALQPKRYRPSNTADLIALAELANTEIAICAMAHHFLGTKTSSYSLTITEERIAIFGRKASTSEEMDDVPPAARSLGSADNVPPPPAASPAVALARSGRFLLFDVAPHEQLNKQRRALMFYIDLALKLECTLVLPRARLLHRAVRGGVGVKLEGAEYVRWGQLFDISALRRLLPVVELEDFLASRQPIDYLADSSLGGCSASGEVIVNFNGFSGVKVLRKICDARLQHDLGKLRAMMSRVIAFSGVVDQLQQTQALILRPNVRFVADAYAAASNYVEHAFGSEPFIAVHWRRTDFLLVRRTQPGVLQSVADVTMHVRRVQERLGISRVFLATDSDDAEEVQQLQRAIGFMGFAAGRADVSLYELATRANIEIAICAMAAHFLGTRTSSYTLAILEERAAIFGHASSSSEEMALIQPRNGGERFHGAQLHGKGAL